MRQIQSRKGKLVIVSNRLPVKIGKRKNKLYVQPSPGGLATALRSLQKEMKTLFIGWPGYYPKDKNEQKHIRDILREQHQCYPVFLTHTEFEKYYNGFSNRTLWPLFHYFSSDALFEESEWRTYKSVNQKFFRKVADLVRPQDSIWIHDYHLTLLPRLIREAFPQSAVGFFLHIPFPSSEIFRILPWRTEILEGLLGSDLVGFHTYEYARHFLSSVLRLLGYEHKFSSISIGHRIVDVENFPIGIDFKNYEKFLRDPSIQKEIANSSERLDIFNKKIILSVDRLDYTKGVPQRLKAFELFLERYPEWHNKVTYILLCVPSRTKVQAYINLKQEVDALVGKINGRFGSTSWMPIHYMYRSLPFEKLLPLYAIADVALITPLRDGMNLVAKEYVASRKNNTGVLILSEAAGATAELGEALTVNVNDKEDILSALDQALNMTEEEEAKRMSTMRNRISQYDVFQWAKSFIERIQEVKNAQAKREKRRLTEEWLKKIVNDFKKGKKRLLFLDYDGTLISFASTPDQAVPDEELKRLLLSLSSNPLNTLAVISGRDRLTMEQWLGEIPCCLVAEHGAWISLVSPQEWRSQKPLSTEWKKKLKPILKTYEFQVPGSLVEEKEYGLAWHYRKAHPELGQIKAREIFEYLSEFLANTELQLVHGHKVVEIRIGGINKGEAAKYFLKKKKWDFILALGDDWTDEDLFKVLPSSAYSIKVGYGPTQARFFLESTEEIRDLLRKLKKSQQS